MLGTWHRWLSGVRFLLFRVPMDLRHFSAIWERPAVTGHAFLIGIDHYGVPHNRSDQAFVLTDRDYWPAFVSPELGECESARYLWLPPLRTANTPGMISSSQNGLFVMAHSPHLEVSQQASP